MYFDCPKLPYGSFVQFWQVRFLFPELIWNLADFLTNWFNLIKKFSSRIVFFETNEMTFWPLTPSRRPENVHFFFFFHLEWLKSINVIWSGWNLEAGLTNVAVFHMKWLFAPNPLSGSPKCTFQCPRGLISTQQKKSFDQHSTNFWKLN